MHIRTSRTTRTAVTTVALLTPAATLTGGTASADTGSSPGDVVTAHEQRFLPNPVTPSNAKSWKVHYRSTDAAPELKVKSTATGGVPSDLNKLADFSDGNVGSGLTLMAAVGQDAAFPELKLDGYLNKRGALQKRIAERECVELGAGSWPFGKVEDITTKNPLNEPAWQQRLARSRLGTRAPDAPVFLYHAKADELIPYSQGPGLRDAWQTKGAQVDFHTIPAAEHLGGAIAGSPMAMHWLGERFAQ